MKILLCGPVSLKLVGDLVEDGEFLPHGYQYPLAAYLARTFHQMGHHVCLVSSANHSGERRHWKGERFEIFLASRRKYLAFVLDQYCRERKEMVDYIRAAQPDIVHAQWTYEFADAALSSNMPYLVTARDAPKTIARLMRSPYRYYRAWYAGRVLPKVKNLSAISGYVSNAIKSEYRLKLKVPVIPNGLAVNLFRSNEDLQFKHPIKNFVCVSGWGSLKNVKTLLFAFGELRRRAGDISLSLVGSGLGKNERAERWAKKHNLHHGVVFLGRQSHREMLNILRDRADCFVHSTLEESFCMAVLEAMAQGLPIVALPDSGAVPWLLDYGRAGVIAASHQAADLANAMEHLLKDPISAEKLALAGHQRALENFTLEAVASQYLKVYKNIIAKNDTLD